MEKIALLPSLLVLLASLPPLPLALPMTDYSQLNHDEPTHWTKAATTESTGTEGVWSVLSKVREHLGPSRRVTGRPPTGTAATEDPATATATAPDTTKTKHHTTGPLLAETATTPEPAPETSPARESHTLGDGFGMAEEESPVEPFGRATRNVSEPPERMSATERPAPEGGKHEGVGTDPTPGGAPEETPGVDATDPVLDSGYSNYVESNVNLEENRNYFEEDSGGKNNEGDVRKVETNSFNDSEHFYRYDLIDDIKSLFNNDNEAITGKEDSGREIDEERDDYRSPEFGSPLPTYKTLLVHKVDDVGFDSEQEEEEMKKDDARSMYDGFALPTIENSDDSYDSETPFKEWDRDSEEQEKILENIVLQTGNETSDRVKEGKAKSSDEHSGRWFILLLAGNSTIVRLRQKDFAKYLKLNLAARLSLEYDELRVNRVVLAPPRLMVNVSVVPSEAGNLDEEFDLNERLFGEEEAPLHKLAETNATLLELSGEEYHVVRFLSLRSEQPVSLDEVASETSVVINDRHTDIEKVIYIGVGGACIIVIIPLIFALCRLYVLPKKIKWPWKREKPLFANPWNGPRHRRMEEPPPAGGPLTVIYSGSFVERNGPPSGSWLEDDYHNSSILQEEPTLENPVYGFSALNRNVVPEMCDPTVLESPRFNIDSKLHILSCRPSHLLLPHTPVKRSQHNNTLDVRIPKGLDNPNYQT